MYAWNSFSMIIFDKRYIKNPPPPKKYKILQCTHLGGHFFMLLQDFWCGVSRWGCSFANMNTAHTDPKLNKHNA